MSSFLKHFALWSVLVCASATSGGLAFAGPFDAGASPTWQEYKDAGTAREVFKVLHFVDSTAKPQAAGSRALVVVDAGSAEGLLKGSLLKVFRPSGAVGAPTRQGGDDRLWVEMGSLKVVQAQDRLAIAEVTVNGSAMAQAFFPKFAGIMAGDLCVVQQVQLTRNKVMTPSLEIAYHEFFEDPKAGPTNFELTTEGYAQLREVAQRFAHARVSMLMIEAYTDQHGPSEANRVESYQRAMTIRQFFVDELGFDEKRVLAVGYGEAEPADESMAPGHSTTNRRVVFKVVPVTP